MSTPRKRKNPSGNSPGGSSSRRRVSGQSGSTVTTADAPASPEGASPTPPPPERAQPGPATRTQARPIAGRQDTLIVSSLGAAFSPQVAHRAAKDVTSEREAEAITLVDKYLTRDVANVENVVIPRNHDRRAAASTLGTAISVLLEALLDAPPNSSRHYFDGKVLEFKQALNDSIGSRYSLRTRHTGFVDAVLRHFRACESWLRGSWTVQRGRRLTARAKEKALYELFPEFVLLIARCVGQYYHQKRLGGLQNQRREYRLILPYEKVDTKPKDAEEKARVDIGLVIGDPLVEPHKVHRMTYADLSMIVEAKGSTREQEIAYRQMFRYSRPIYQFQPDRRYLWGLTVCDTDVRVLLFAPMRAYSSEVFDVVTTEGRRTLVDLFVRWSLCEWDQCGYDSAIIRRTLGSTDNSVYYEIPVNSFSQISAGTGGEGAAGTGGEGAAGTGGEGAAGTGGEGAAGTGGEGAAGTGGEGAAGTAVGNIFYCRNPFAVADRLFGRHTRCFRGSFISPNIRRAEDGGVIEEFVLKTGWPEATIDPELDSRDEVRILQRINEKLRQNDRFKNMYPNIVCGGRVQLDIDGVQRQDSTDLLLAAMNVDVPQHRVHKRLITQPIGKQLSNAGSVLELIAVLVDVMTVHTEIFKECQILHRDISISNTLVWRDTDESARGMLIDFDLALPTDQVDLPAGYKRTGTLPFMSINNLEENSNQRTSLDDWEAFLAVVCWIGTFGWQEVDARNDPALTSDDRPIMKWREGSRITIAAAKRGHFDSTVEFYDKIVKHFKEGPGSNDMKLLACLLRDCLFESSVVSDSDAHGTTLKKPSGGGRRIDYSQPFVPPVKIDPFQVRVQHAEAICDRALHEMREFLTAVKDRSAAAATAP